MAQCCGSNTQHHAENIKLAVKHDNDEEFEKAFDCYMRALEQFQLHCKYDKNEHSKATIQEKMREYLSRAEYLKGVIANQTKTDHTGDASTAVGQKKKPPVRTSWNSDLAHAFGFHVFC